MQKTKLRILVIPNDVSKLDVVEGQERLKIRLRQTIFDLNYNRVMVFQNIGDMGENETFTQIQ